MPSPDLPSPRIFVSATSADLGFARRVVGEGLGKLGCVAVEQEAFPPDTRRVRDMLREKLAGCDAMVHLVGHRYGAEPTERAPDEPRRSYTQLEYDMARQLDLPVYLFVSVGAEGAGGEGADGAHAGGMHPEDAEREELQRQHRRAILEGDHRYDEFDSADALRAHVHALQDRVDQLAQALESSRSTLRRTLLLGAVAVVVLAGGLAWLWDRTDATEERLEERLDQVETEVERQRRYIVSAATAVHQLKDQLAEWELTDDELWVKAIERIARTEGVPAPQLQASIDLFVTVVQQDGDAASLLDQALAAQASASYGRAGDLALEAAARIDLEASEEAVEQAEDRLRERRAEKRETLTLGGTARSAEGRPADAVAAFREALEPIVTPRETEPQAWAKLQVLLGSSLYELTRASAGDEAPELLRQSREALALALEDLDRQQDPYAWASAQNRLGIALSELADQSDGATAVALLDEAADRHWKALGAWEEQEESWSVLAARSNLGNVLLEHSEWELGEERERLLELGVGILRATVEQEEGLRQGEPIRPEIRLNLAYGLLMQAEGKFVMRAVRYTEALELADELDGAFDPEREPEKWADLQMLRARIIAETASLVPSRRREAMAEAEALAAAALSVWDRDEQPIVWAYSQLNLAVARSRHAQTLEGPDRLVLLEEAAEGYRLVREVWTRDGYPRSWAKATGQLGHVLYDQSQELPDALAVKLLRQSLQEYRAALEVYRELGDPKAENEWEEWLAGLEAELVERGG